MRQNLSMGAQRQNEKYNKLLKKIGVIDGIVLCSDFNNWLHLLRIGSLSIL
ncbi:MAG TPA: hypothetical protein VJR94_00845 [Candidatus Nitrosocosmicus sp.]|nr:hypothetical protein [Candidatus Nitrosocosmicus sp.]